jgi:hypothetical protein
MCRAWILVAVAACSSKDEPPPPTAPVTVRDAGVAIDGITVIGHFDPASGMHLDEDGPNIVRPRLPKGPPGKLVDITLRSSPPGAIAAVDGQQIGRTPTYAPVMSGAQHDFTFVLDGYSAAHYRFVPIQSGVVHATLEVVTAETDAGVQQLPPEVLRPTEPPPPVPPPATIVQPPPPPVDAADAADAATVKTGPLPF